MVDRFKKELEEFLAEQRADIITEKKDIPDKNCFAAGYESGKIGMINLILYKLRGENEK